MKNKRISIEDAFKKYSQSKVGAKELRRVFGNDSMAFKRAKSAFFYNPDSKEHFNDMKEAREYFRDIELQHSDYDAWQRKKVLKEVYGNDVDLRKFNKQFTKYQELEFNKRHFSTNEAGIDNLDYEIAGYYDTVKNGQVLAKTYVYYSAESPVLTWQLVNASEVGL